jgi:two-component system, NtrC family, sensor histidine kinase HydH
MTADQWLLLGTCAAQLALAFIVLTRSRGGRTAVPLVLLCLDIFTWNIAKLAFDLTGAPVWRWLEIAALPIMTPLGIHFILAFIGRSRAAWRWLTMIYLLFGGLGAAALVGLLFPRWSDAIASVLPQTILACAIPTITVTFVGLVRYLRKVSEPGEQARGWMLLTALIISSDLLCTELAARMGLAVPRLGNVGALVGTLAMTLVLLRFPLLERHIPSLVALLASALAALATLACMLALRLGHGALAVVLCAIFAAAAFLALRQSISIYGRRRKRQGRLAHQGRFSVQMAHDLRNPLAALKGAAQYLREEVRQGRPLAQQDEYLDLMIAQIERLERTVDEHQRMGRLQLQRVPRPLNDLVRDIMSLRAVANDPRIALALELSPLVPECAVDADLLARALENLCQNAIEAMPEGGRLVVKTSLEESGNVLLSISDTGCGMDPRTQERATDAFYTTKRHGTGLGLSFARDVVEGHGGQLQLASERGRGTTVNVRLPRD